MRQLRESLVLTDAMAISLLRKVTKDGNTFVPLVKGPLTPELADTLRCRNQVYNLNDNPWPALKSLSLDREISNSELSVPTHSNLQPAIVTGFTIKPSEAADADGALELFFRMKFSSGKQELNELLDAVKDNSFDLALLALQGGLFDQPSSQGDGPEGGTKVNLSGDGSGEPADGEKPDEDETTGAAPPPRRRRATAIG